jgi:plastocyanin
MQLLGAALILTGAGAGQVTVTARLEADAPAHMARSTRNIVLWLTPQAGPAPVELTDKPQQHPSLVQKNKSFVPHLLVVEVGTVVDFPNHDPFFHNVFSLFEGKRFDLGLYEAGTTRHVRFDRPGICYIFCNIHPEMSAVVVVVDTPYYAIATNRSTVEIPRVPAGKYTLHVWDERSLPEELANLTREVSITPETASLGTIRIRETEVAVAHKNKYGQDYPKPAPPGPGYIPQ